MNGLVARWNYLGFAATAAARQLRDVAGQSLQVGAGYTVATLHDACARSRLSNATPVVKTCARYWTRSGVSTDLCSGMSCLASASIVVSALNVHSVRTADDAGSSGGDRPAHNPGAWCPQ